jgi:hypothetical protein
MKKLQSRYILIFLCLLISGCVSNPVQKDNDLNMKIAAEKPADTPDEIAQRGASTFISAPGLSDAQRQKLMEVYTRTYFGAENIRTQIGQAKSLMFKMIAKQNYKSKEMQTLKTKIVGLDQSRLQLMFQALADVQAIVGYGNDSEKEKIYQHFEKFEVPNHSGRTH